MPHVELSLTELSRADLLPTEAPDAGAPTARRREPAPTDPVAWWARAVRDAIEPCLVIDAKERVVAMSPSCLRILGLRRAPVGQPLTEGALRLMDFSADGAFLTQSEVGKIPPLLSLSSGRLARGLIRVECDGSACTLDAVATPLGEQTDVVGSLTFFSPV